MPGTTSYTYDAGDRLLSAGSMTFTYDRSGNQISKTTGTTTVNYSYDDVNRLIAATGGGIDSQYRYDGDGNRVSQTVPTGTYQYLSDTASALPVVLNEAGPDGNIDYLYGLGMISETSNAFQYYYQSDELGSTASMTDSAGSLKANYTYDPWGKLITPIDPLGTKNKYKFTGEALDPGSGLYYLRARYYDSNLGRFLSRDPSRAGLNGYGYANANPQSWVDPSGLSGILRIFSERGVPGHSWVSYMPDNGSGNGQTTTWGNWPGGWFTPQGHAGVNKNYVEAGWTCNATTNCTSRATYLNDAQEAQFYAAIDQYQNLGGKAYTWTGFVPAQDCSTFAADVWQKATGEQLSSGSPNNPLGIKAPVKGT